MEKNCSLNTKEMSEWEESANESTRMGMETQKRQD